MARAVKQWLDEVGSGTDLEAPDEDAQTIVDAAALRDMETRDGAYVDAQIATEVTNRNGAIAAAVSTKANTSALTTETTARTDADTALANAVAARQLASEKEQANGYPGLTAGGFILPARLGSGSRDGSKFLRDDGTWQPLPAPNGSETYVWDGGAYVVTDEPARMFVGPVDPTEAGFTPRDGDSWDPTGNA